MSPNTVLARCGGEVETASLMSPKTLDTSSTRPLADDLHRMRRVGRQVGDEHVQFGAGHRGVGGVGPLTELVEVDPSLADGRLEARDDRLAIGVGGAHGRQRIQVVGHAPTLVDPGRGRPCGTRVGAAGQPLPSQSSGNAAVQKTVSASTTFWRPAQVPP